MMSLKLTIKVMGVDPGGGGGGGMGDTPPPPIF